MALVGLAGAIPHPGFDEFEFRHQARIQDQEARVQEEEGGDAHNEEYVKQNELSSAQIAAYFKYGGYNLAAKEEAEIQDDKDSLPADFDDEIAKHADNEDDENPEEESPGQYYAEESPGEVYAAESPGEDYAEYNNYDNYDEGNAVKMDGPGDGNEGDYLPAELEDDYGFIEDFESSREAAEGEIPSHQATSAKPSNLQDNVFNLLVVDRDQTDEKTPELQILVLQPDPTIQATNSERKAGNSPRGAGRPRGDGRGEHGAAKASVQDDGLNVGNRDQNTGTAPDGQQGFEDFFQNLAKSYPQPGGAGGQNNENQYLANRHSQQTIVDDDESSESVMDDLLQGLVIVPVSDTSDALYYYTGRAGGNSPSDYAYNGGGTYNSAGQYGSGPNGGQYRGGGARGGRPRGGAVKSFRAYRLPLRYIIYTSQFKQRDC